MRIVVQGYLELSEEINAFICGVQKAGTTSLFQYLREHPQLQAPDRKELHIFDDEERDWSSTLNISLEQYYPQPACGRIRFEATPIYIYWPNSIERLYKYNPSARLICIFRDPVERAWSQWCMQYARGVETLSFAEAIRNGRARLSPGDPFSVPNRVYSYVERGRYGEQVERLLNIYPREQILFLRSEDLASDPSAVLNSISDHLAVSPFVNISNKREHARVDMAYPSRLTELDRVLIARELAQDIARFSQLTGLDTTRWPVCGDGW